MDYCTEEDLIQYILEQYLEKVEELNPGSVENHIKQVSGEIDEALLQGGFSVPEENTSKTLNRICAVMVAWRSVGEITSLMDTEASSGNEWLPLQRLHAKAEKDLDKVREGKLNPFPSSHDDSGIEVSTSTKMFGSDVWGKF